MDAQEAVDQFWEHDPGTVRTFFELLPAYAELADEVAFALTKHLDDRGVEYASVSSRAKTLKSFCEKAIRKGYDDPVAQMTDLAGARVVYLYASDLALIEEIIQLNFEVAERVDRTKECGVHEFGYGAVHYVVRLNLNTGGPRYDMLKGFPCEIQVRTALQDAWALVAHHLSYKREEDVPRKLQRKLGALSGTFETIDEMISDLQETRKYYQVGIRKQLGEDREEALGATVNLDNLLAYMRWRFPDREDGPADSFAVLLEELSDAGYKRIRDLHEASVKAEVAFARLEMQHPPAVRKWGTGEVPRPGRFNRVGAVRSSLSIADDGFLDVRRMPDRSREAFRERYAEYRTLLRDV